MEKLEDEFWEAFISNRISDPLLVKSCIIDLHYRLQALESKPVVSVTAHRSGHPTSEDAMKIARERVDRAIAALQSNASLRDAGLV